MPKTLSLENDLKYYFLVRTIFSDPGGEYGYKGLFLLQTEINFSSLDSFDKI